MSIQQLLNRYDMKPHEENGTYCENHYPYRGEGRAPSGSSYFFVAPGQSTAFHRIDCDEYWCHNAGDGLEVWVIDTDGQLEIKKFGVCEGSEPTVFFPKGVIFGSKNRQTGGEGTFFTCVTVPRFGYDGFELFEKDDIITLCPEAEKFFE